MATMANFKIGFGARCVNFEPTKAPIINPDTVCRKIVKSKFPEVR